MTKLVNQPNAKPSRKAQFGGAGAVTATVLAAAISATGIPYFERLFSYPGLETALGGIITLLFFYVAKEYAP